MSGEVIYYKFLNEDGTPCNGGSGKWFRPRGRRPGKWMAPIKDPSLCVRGYHVCTRDQRIFWLGPVLWIVEVKGEHEDGADKSVWE